MSHKLIKLNASIFICNLLDYNYVMYIYLIYNMTRFPSFIYFNALLTLSAINIFGYYEKFIILTTLMLSYINSNQEKFINKINKLKYFANSTNINIDNNKVIMYIDKFNNIESVKNMYNTIDNNCDLLIDYIIKFIKMKYNQTILNNDYIKKELEEFKKIKMEFEKIKNDNMNDNMNNNMNNNMNDNGNIKDNTQNFELDEKELELIDKKLDDDLDNLTNLIKTLNNNSNKTKLDVIDLDNLDERFLINNNSIDSNDSTDDSIDEPLDNNKNKIDKTIKTDKSDKTDKNDKTDKLDFLKTIDFNKMFGQLMTLKEKKLNIKLE